MARVILSDDRQYRYNEALKAMDVLMSPEFLCNAHIGNVNMGHVLRHLSASGVTIGVFLQEYFAQKEEAKVVVEVNESFKCACNRMFGSKQALNGHKRT